MRTQLIVLALATTFTPAIADAPTKQPDSMTIDCERKPVADGKQTKQMSLWNRSGYTIEGVSLLVVDTSDGDHVVAHIADIKSDPGYKNNGIGISGTKPDTGEYTCTARVFAPGKWK